MKNKIDVKRENWKGKYIYVVRKNGKILSKRNVKGSNTTIESIREKFKKSNTLNPNIKEKVILNKNLKYITSPLNVKPRVKKLYSRQVGVKVTWYEGKKKIGVTYGYSEKGLEDKNGKKKAYDMARNKAINEYNYFDYEEMTKSGKSTVKGKAEYFRVTWAKT